MATKKLPPFVVFLMVLAVLALAAAALRPIVEELRLTWKLRSPEESDWKRAADALIERGRRSGLSRALATALARDPKDFGSWQRKLFERRPRDLPSALPAYEASLRHEEAAVRRAAIAGLLSPEWRRPEAVPDVAAALESADPVLRWQAGYVLHRMGPGAAGAAPALVRAASDPDENVRWAAVYALGAMAPASPDAVSALVRALGDPSVLVASHAAGALAGFGPRAPPAVPALVEAFRKGDIAVKVEAARALGTLGRTAREALPILLEALNAQADWQYESFGYVSISDTNGEVLNDAPPVSRGPFRDMGPHDGRISILEAVLRLGAEAGELLPCLSKLVRDPSYPVRQAAATALGRIGPAASAAVPDLVKILMDKEPTKRWSYFPSAANYAAADALGAMGPEAVQALVEALRSSDPRTKHGAARALGRMDRADARTIEALRSALSDARFTVAIAAARGLKRFEPGADVVPALLDAAARCSSGDEGIWWDDQGDLDGLAGKEALPSLPLLRDALSREVPFLRFVAVRLLASMARETVEPLRELLAVLETRDESLRRHAVTALGGLASRAEEVVPPLVRILEADPERDIRLTAAGSLGRLGMKAESALPALWARYHAEEKEQDRSPWLAAISAISPGDPRAIELRLREARGDWGISAALDLIVKADPAARPLLPAAEEYLEHESLGVRLKAARALWAIDRRVEPVLAVARQALVDDWSSGWWFQLFPWNLHCASQWRNPVREEAAQLVSEMGSAGKPAVPELIACLEFPGETVRVLAAEALRRAAGDTRLDVLIGALEESVPGFSSDPTRMEDYTAETLRILGEMGPEAQAAIPSLERLRARAPAGPLRTAVDEALRKVARERT